MVKSIFLSMGEELKILHDRIMKERMKEKLYNWFSLNVSGFKMLSMDERGKLITDVIETFKKYDIL